MEKLEPEARKLVEESIRDAEGKVRRRREELLRQLEDDEDD